MRCEDYPCCGHGPASTGGDGGGCPDAEGRFNCVGCGKKLPKRATSALCSRCARRSVDADYYGDRESDWDGEGY